MMYTPTPATRRPRPPNSLNRSRPHQRQRQLLVSSNSEPTLAAAERNRPRPALLPNTAVNKLKAEEDSNITPLSAYRKQRQEDARNNLSRISASPADVSFALDVNSSTSPSSSRSQSYNAPRSEGQSGGSLGLGISSSLRSTLSGHSEPSPPPPYGPTLMNDNELIDSPIERSPTPPQQESGRSSRRVSTSPSQVSKICDPRQQIEDLIEAPGTEAVMEEGAMEDEHSEAEDGEDELTEGEVRDQLREVKSLLLRREEAARVAEQALGSHEQIMSVLPDQLKYRLADLHEGSDLLGPGSAPYPYDEQFPTSHLRTYRPMGDTAITTNSNSMDHLPSTSMTQQSRTAFQPPPLHYPVASTEVSPEEEVSSEDYWSRKAHDAEMSKPGLNRHRIARPNIFSVQSSTPAQPPTPRYDRLAALQIEAEDRIMALEQALSEARDGEEAQRKTAARWRKEADKMQRELVRVDEDRVKSEQEALRDSVVGQAGWRKRTEQPEVVHQAGVFLKETVRSPEHQDLGWGYTSYPEFPSSGPSRIKTPHPMRAGHGYSSSTLVESESRRPSLLTVQTIPVDSLDTLSVTSFEDERDPESIRPKAGSSSRGSLRHSSTKETKTLKRMTSKFKFLSPKMIRFRGSSEGDATKQDSTSLTPRVTIESPQPSPSSNRRRGTSVDGSQSSGRSVRKSPYPLRKPTLPDDSPIARRTIDFAPSRDISRESSLSPSVSPAFASLSSRMASVRAQINRSLSLDPSMFAGMGRTLGSELGSEYGEDWDKGMRSLEYIEWQQNQPEPVRSPSASPSPPSRRSTSILAINNDESESESDMIHNNEEDTSTTYLSPVYQPSYPLPPGVSAALSSLATALKPASVFAASPSPSLRVPTVGNVQRHRGRRSANELFREIAQSARIDPNAGAVAAMPSSSGQQRMPEAQHRNDSAPSDRISHHDSMKAFRMTNAHSAGKDGNSSILSNTSLGRKVYAKRAISFGVGHRESPRKFALAHRRMHSLNRQSQHMTMALNEKALIDAKGRAKIGIDSLVPMKPDQTLTRRGIRYIRTSTEVKMDELTKTSSRQIQTTSEDRLIRRKSEPSTIPAKVVHDIFCLIAIWLEYIEWMIILGIRFCMDIRDGPRGPSGVRQGERPKRYYI
uniref:Uncharacterized protein n=1 Tax=Kwoniella dejecticola CBS 10117 TaxID=1296121 RepID=A0A1A6AGH9_9TREE|nr:uncharacterized protein I303_01004 [Kwoniella dejecticola CBS 10117]OBR89180.1 hypothetical protein I303_01004 [Kwoniella dejecticola CBS 10117]